MLKVLGHVPPECMLAVSGGPDSMAALHFLSYKEKRRIKVVFYHHGDKASDEALVLVKSYCESKDISLLTNEEPCLPCPKGRSQEEWWRYNRFLFMERVSKGLPIITGHNLDDQVETWIFSCMNGNPDLIPYSRKSPNIIRPFLLAKKDELLQYCIDKGVPYLMDPENENLSHRRVYIRKKIKPLMLEVQPGLYKIVAKKTLSAYNKKVSSN